MGKHLSPGMQLYSTLAILIVHTTKCPTFLLNPIHWIFLSLNFKAANRYIHTDVS